MRAIPLILAAAVGLAIGVTSTWLALHRETGSQAAAATAAAKSPDKQVLYWYDPMAPNEHFDKPGKSPRMDMQLVPKYAGDSSDGAGVVSIDPREVQNLGLRIARAERGSLNSAIRVTGTVAFDERAVSVVQARVAGIVEHLDVRAPLTAVMQGQPLLTLLAPDWTAAQEEYLSLQRSRTPGLEELRSAARQRLQLLGMSETQIRNVEKSGLAQTRITVTAPRDGVIGDLAVREGATVVGGAPLLRINGLDTVWINAAIPEAQIGRVSSTSTVEVELLAFPGERFAGEVENLLADLDPATRTQTARIVLRNPGHRLAPGMFAQVRIAQSTDKAQGVLIPTEAVIATGTRNVVIVADGPGHFRAQQVRAGDEAGGKTQILEGVADGENVVLSGQFLIDSEASLAGTLARLAGGNDARDHKTVTPQPSPDENSP